LISISITAGLLALAGCGGSEPDTATKATTLAPETAASPATSPAASPAQPAPVAAVSGAPDALQFTAPLVGGGTLDLASLAGPPVLLWFWAPF
jgi:hypothetical protein